MLLQPIGYNSKMEHLGYCRERTLIPKSATFFVALGKAILKSNSLRLVILAEQDAKKPIRVSHSPNQVFAFLVTVHGPVKTSL